jgi:hypothetical protein
MVGTSMHVGDAWRCDQLQQILGIEARLEHDVAAVAERQHAVGTRRRVIHRAVHQHDLVVLGLMPIGDGATRSDAASCSGRIGLRRTPFGMPVVPEV